MTSHLLIPVVLAFSAGSTSDALAAPRGAVISASQLPAAHRSRLRRQVEQARRSHAASFEAIAKMRARLPTLARRQRGRVVSLVLPLRAMGGAALMPMLAELALDSKGRGALSNRAWRGWRMSLLEAVGSLRDPRAKPVLEAVVRSEQRDAAVIRAGARALARLGTKSAATTLIRLARGRDAKRRLAVLAALGECRRPRVARELAAILRAAGDETTRRLTIASLGQVGNLWAWRAEKRAGRGGGDTTRRFALEALIAAYPVLGTTSREAAAKAVLLISHPSTSARIAAARADADAKGAAALDQLARRVARDGLLR
jgi:HEAT repeat protein